ncbi:MAG: hypothetical protein C4567_18320 [Deltaproteobacteria bacterium]|nr:MAG: hypothetical protein C4567_18320 [Deltaproteobacteria bacterium]
MRPDASRLALISLIFSGLAVIFLLIAAPGVPGGEKSPALPEEGDMATPQSITASAKSAPPPIDLAAPAKTATATFALG